MPDIIYCKNKKCKNYKSLNEVTSQGSVTFNYDLRHYNPIGKDVFEGMCGKSLGMLNHYYETHDMFTPSAVCDVNSNEKAVGDCNATDCSWNHGRVCERKIVFVDNSLLTKLYSCKNYAHTVLKDRIDILKFLNNDGTAKGGHIDDDYANKMYYDNLKYKSFPKGHRDSKEPKKKSAPR